MADPTLHIAWTIDDGPTPHTKAMAEVFGDKPATWYIQRNNLTPSHVPIYQNLQNKQGHEIAIHGVHPKNDHLCWFPSDNLPSYDNLGDALDDLEEFHKELKDAGLKTRFVRLPYGLFTELDHTLKKRGLASGRGAAARGMIAGTSGSDNAAVRATDTDFRSLTSTLKRLELYLWGGSSSGKVSPNSWEAESAAEGTSRRQDDTVPQKQINMMRDVLPRRSSKSASFVILCHDTSAADVKEVKDDIKSIEDVAKETKTTIKYHTMTSLYAQVTKKSF